MTLHLVSNAPIPDAITKIAQTSSLPFHIDEVLDNLLYTLEWKRDLVEDAASADNTDIKYSYDIRNEINKAAERIVAECGIDKDSSEEDSAELIYELIEEIIVDRIHENVIEFLKQNKKILTVKIVDSLISNKDNSENLATEMSDEYKNKLFTSFLK